MKIVRLYSIFREFNRCQSGESGPQTQCQRGPLMGVEDKGVYNQAYDHFDTSSGSE